MRAALLVFALLALAHAMPADVKPGGAPESVFGRKLRSVRRAMHIPSLRDYEVWWPGWQPSAKPPPSSLWPPRGRVCKPCLFCVIQCTCECLCVVVVVGWVRLPPG